MTEVERKLLIWVGELYMRASPLTYEAGEISELIAAVRRPIPQPAPEPAWSDARTVCGEVYQVVGVLAERWPDCNLARVLDNLSAATEGRPVPHATLLPFVLPEPAKVAPAPVTDAMVQAALRRWYSHRGNAEESMRDVLTVALTATPARPDPLREAVRDLADAYDAYASLGDDTEHMRGATTVYGLARDRLRAILETGR